MSERNTFASHQARLASMDAAAFVEDVGSQLVRMRASHRLLGVLLLISAALMLLASAGLVLVGLARGSRALVVVLLAVPLNVLGAALYGLLGAKLLSSASRIARAVDADEPAHDLAEALRHQAVFWNVVTVVSTLAFAFYLAIGLLGGLMAFANA